MHKPACESAIAPIIAEILMVALICLAAGIAYVFVFQIPSIEKIPMVAADITKNGSYVSLFFKNGDPLEQGRFYVTVNGDRVPDGNIRFVSGSYPWSPGEMLVANYSGTGAIRDVKLVYLGKPTSVVLASAYFSAPSGNTTPVNTTPLYSRYPGFTAEAWMKWTQNPTPAANDQRWATIVVDGNDDSNRVYVIAHDSTNAHIQFGFRTANNNYGSINSDTVPQAGVWYHAVEVYNQTPGTFTVYVNGIQQVGTGWWTTDSSGMHSSPGLYQVGGPAGISYGGAAQRKFNGDISGLKTYGEALSQAEILLHYTAGVP